jgi:hypothetical protein
VPTELAGERFGERQPVSLGGDDILKGSLKVKSALSTGMYFIDRYIEEVWK